MMITMNQNQKHGIISFIGGIGLIILFAGIFIPNFPFNLALVIAISLWMLTGVVSKLLGITRKGELSNTDWKNAVVALLSVMGVIVLLMGIFLGYSFDLTLFIALAFWILSVSLASFFGINNKKPKKNYPKSTGYLYPAESNIPSDNPNYSSNRFGSPSMKAHQASKNFCQACGSPIQQDDTFCSNCGSMSTRS